MVGRFFSSWSNVERHSFINFPFKTAHLWRWMVYLEKYLCRGNAKVSCTPRAVIGSSSSISRIQEFRKCSDGISFLYECLGVALWRMRMLYDSLSFITTLRGGNLWSKGRVNLILAVGLHSLSQIVMCNYFASSNLIGPRMFLCDIGKMFEGIC